MSRGHRFAAAVLASLTVIGIAGCNWRPFYHWGDPRYAFGIDNDTAQPRIVSFGSSWDAYVVPAGEAGMAAEGLGGMTGTIAVMDESCRVLQELEITTQRGNVIIPADGAARLEATDHSFTAFLERTERCREE